MAGKARFIIAHPERCALFQDNISLVRNYVARGMLVQVNIAGILGLYGKRGQNTALELFRAGLVHFLATDSHASEGRMPPDIKQMAQLNRILGEDAVLAAFRDNPSNLLEGREIRPVQVDPDMGAIPSAGGFIKRFKRIFTDN